MSMSCVKYETYQSSPSAKKGGNSRLMLFWISLPCLVYLKIKKLGLQKKTVRDKELNFKNDTNNLLFIITPKMANIMGYTNGKMANNVIYKWWIIYNGEYI